MAFINNLEFKAQLFIIRFGVLPLHLNMFSTSDVKELIINHDFRIIEAEKIFFGMTSVFIVARKL
jgi:hypothetical protein